MADRRVSAYGLRRSRARRDSRGVVVFLLRRARFGRRAAGIRINAELRCGQILEKQEKALPIPKGSKRNGEGGKVSIRSGDRTQLKDLGISKNQSAEWQRMAKDPEAVRKYIKEETGVPTTAGAVAAASPICTARNLSVGWSRIVGASLC
jgi:hypothetical protein